MSLASRRVKKKATPRKRAAVRNNKRPRAGRKTARGKTPEANRAPAAKTLLAWYDRHRRRLPWRAEPGQNSDPYRVWLSEIMLQQTTVKAVAPYYEKFLTRWPDVRALAAADLEDVLKLWAGLGYYARARNLLACAQAVMRDHGGYFPDREEMLRALPGVGRYTAAAIAAIAFGRKATPVDGNIERVIARLHAIEEPLPAAKATIQQRAEAMTPQRRAGDFAQAMMDLGATLCSPKRPACVLCPWNGACLAARRGDAESFPRKSPKAEGRLRRGAAFVALRADGAILVRTRPQKGLLGGMTEVPTMEWSHDFDEATALGQAPLKAKWRRLPGSVTHVFTHFPLQLSVYKATLSKAARAPQGARWIAAHEIASAAFPNVMRKVIAHALEMK